MPYLTPDEVPEGRACRALFIPDDTAWLSLVSGILTEATKIWNWQEFGTLTPQECVDVMNEIVLAYYESENCGCALPEGGEILRAGEFGELQMLSGGEWVEPTGDYAIPEPEARSEPTSEERRCAAAANAENVLMLMYEDITDSWTANLSTADAIISLVATVAGLIPIPVSLAVRGLAILALAVWRSAYSAAAFVTNDLWDADFSLNMRCMLYRQSIDTAGVVTFDFAAVNAELINQIDWIDPTIFSYTLAGQVRWMLSQITPAGLNLAGETTAISDPGCDDCDNCTSPSVTFGTGTQGFTTNAWDIFPAAGTHMNNVFGIGWYADSTGGFNQIGINGGVSDLCGTGININLTLSGGMPTTPVMKIRVTTATQEKNATFTPVSGAQNITWDEGGSIVPANGLVEIGYRGSSGYGAFIASFQLGDV